MVAELPVEEHRNATDRHITCPIARCKNTDNGEFRNYIQKLLSRVPGMNLTTIWLIFFVLRQQERLVASVS